MYISEIPTLLKVEILRSSATCKLTAFSKDSVEPFVLDLKGIDTTFDPENIIVNVYFEKTDGIINALKLN